MNNFPNITEILLNTFNTLVSQFVEFTPRVIGSIIILIIGYLVAKSLKVLLFQVLGRIGLDRFGERLNEIAIIKKLKTEIKLSRIVARISYYYVLLIFLAFAADTLGVDTITNMVLSLVAFVPKLIIGAVILQIGIMLSDFVRTSIVTICKSFNIVSARLIGNIVFIFFLFITFITAMGHIGIETTLLQSSFILIIGGVFAAFGLGYGLASKDVLANIISSFYSCKNFSIGQLIRIGDVKGVISKMDNTTITIVNGTTTTIVPQQLFQTSKVEIFNS